jgi:hypothetical protein
MLSKCVSSLEYNNTAMLHLWGKESYNKDTKSIFSLEFR